MAAYNCLRLLLRQITAWDVPANSIVPSLASLRDIVWATQSSMFGWPVMGVWQPPPSNIQQLQQRGPGAGSDLRRRAVGSKKGVPTSTALSARVSQQQVSSAVPGATFANVTCIRRNRGGAEALLVASSTGSLSVYNYPALPTDTGNCQTQTAHAVCVSGADFMSGDRQVISVCASDGTTVCWSFSLATEKTAEETDFEEEHALLRRFNQQGHAIVSAADLWRAYVASVEGGVWMFLDLSFDRALNILHCILLAGVSSAMQWRNAGPDGTRGTSAAAAVMKHVAMARVEASIASHASAVVREIQAERVADQRKHMLSAYMGPAAISAKRAVTGSAFSGGDLPKRAEAPSQAALALPSTSSSVATPKATTDTAFIGMNPMARRLLATAPAAIPVQVKIASSLSTSGMPANAE
jgi:hypothetical protein